MGHGMPKREGNSLDGPITVQILIGVLKPAAEQPSSHTQLNALTPNPPLHPHTAKLPPFNELVSVGCQGKEMA